MFGCTRRVVCIQTHCFVVPVVAGDEDPLRQGRFQTHVFQQSVTLTAKMWPDVSKERLWLVLFFVGKTRVSKSSVSYQLVRCCYQQLLPVGRRVRGWPGAAIGWFTVQDSS